MIENVHRSHRHTGRTWLIAAVLLATAAAGIATLVVRPGHRSSPSLPPHFASVPQGSGTLHSVAGADGLVQSVAPHAAWLGAHNLIVGPGGSPDCPNVAMTARAVTAHQLAVSSKVVDTDADVCSTVLAPEYTVLPVPAAIDRSTPVEITIDGTADSIELPAYPSQLPSTCVGAGITAQVFGHPSVGLLTCAGLAGMIPVPAFTITVGQTVIVGENGTEFSTLVVQQTTHAVSLDGTTITARSRGQATIIVSGVYCAPDKTGHQPKTCPLLTVRVS